MIWADLSSTLVPATGSASAFFATVVVDITERKRAEQELRESEQRLQDIVDNTTAVVFVKDLDLRYLLVNREYERRHRVQRDQIRGRTDFDILPHDVAEALREMTQFEGGGHRASRVRSAATNAPIKTRDAGVRGS